MLLAFVLAFYEGNSVAVASRLQGAEINPGALGVETGYQMLFGFNPQDTTYSAALGLWGLGISWQSRNNTSLWRVSSGTKLADGLWFGASWHPESGALDYGLIYRPLRYLSVGLVARDAFRDTRVFSGGLGVRPLWDRLSLFSDVDYSDSVISWRGGAALEFLPGFIVHGYYTKDKSLHVGVDLSLGHLRLSGASSADISRDPASVSPGLVQVEMSKTPYPHISPPRKKWLDITLRGGYSEDGRQFLGQGPRFADFITRLDSAARDPSLSGFLVRLEPGALGATQMEETREALLRARDMGKFVVVYGDAMGAGQFWLASAGDRIVLAPQGELEFPGVKSGSYYLKRALDKLGLYADFERIAEYKTAAEPLTSDTMSDAQKEQITAFLEDIYGYWLDTISEARGLVPESLDALVDVGFFSAKRARNAGLVDTVAYEDEIRGIVNGYANAKVTLVKAADYFSAREVDRRWRDTRPKIALIIAEGNIVSGYGTVPPPLPLPFVGSKSMGKEVARALRKARKDKSIKGVIFRINSGGGSALGSDLIWREVQLTAEKKPVIVSMGGVAGSGGYYIACPATRILADHLTLTGSIGIIGGKIVMKGLFDKLGITKPTVTTGHQHVLMWDETRPFTPEEREFFASQLREGYDDFTSKVAEGRGLSQDSVDAIGRGRIWSGIAGMEVGLVDELGGLVDAVEAAKQEAGIQGDVRLVLYHPKPSGGLPALLGKLVGVDRLLERGGYAHDPLGAYSIFFTDPEPYYYIMEPLELETR